jgi:two-component system, OmpR family, phosphate regulon sensor histidine kinase PhoR
VEYFWIAFSAVATLAYLRQRAKTSALEADLKLLSLKRQAMRRVLEHMNDGALLVGKHDRVLYANPAAWNLLGTEEAADLSLAQIVRSPSLLAAMKSQGASTARRIVHAEFQDGEPLAVELTQAPAGPDRRLLILRDTRDSDEVVRKRRDFVANASHELKTPIAALVGLLDLIDSVAAEKRQELLGRCQRNANHLAELVEDLLGLAKAEDPEWRPTPRSTEVGAVVAEVAALVRERAANKGLSLRVSSDPKPLHLLVDPVALHAVLRNLVQNAVNYTEQGEIWISASQPDSLGVAIEVADTGPGIDPAILPRIFERFFRGDPAHHFAKGGTGLGLSIVRNLVNQMGGRIAVRSEPGRGSSFRIELPANPTRPLLGSTAPRQ